MLYWLTQKGRNTHRAGREIYGELLSFSRNPVFYESCAVPDTFEGRFEILALYTGLVVDRLCSPQMGRDGTVLAQALFDAMFKNLDWGMREMGVGDLGVPKRIKKLMKYFKGRTYAYGDAVRAYDQNFQAGYMIDALERNVYAGQSGVDATVYEKMARHALDCANYLKKLSLNDLQKGTLNLPAFNSNSTQEKKVARDETKYYAA